MKKLIIATLILLLIPFSYAQQSFVNDEKVVMNVDISSNITIERQKPSKITYIAGDLFLFPKQDYRQKVLSKKIDESAIEEENVVKFNWENPEEDKINFNLNYDVETFSQRTEITRKVPFPIKKLDAEFIPYTKPTLNVDSDNEEIIKLASQIVEGEDDLYFAVSKLAAWVENNVEYSLNTLTADVSQKSSWVLTNRFGVCDELTSLFIALSRSLGIPTRYVSGLAYTNWQNFNDWGPHAWAEVYFPDFGWVPFDVTYRQLGFIDSSHIKLDQSTDTHKSSVEYSWLGYNFEPDFDELGFQTKLKEKQGTLDPEVRISITPLKKIIDFASYNLVEAEVENLKDHYVTTNLFLSVSKELKAGQRSKFITLKPRETKKVFWIVRASPDLDEKYIYTFHVAVSTSKNITEFTKFKVENFATYYSEPLIESILEQKVEEEEKKYSKNIEIECETEEEYYNYEDPQVSCTIKNAGNIFLKNLNVCLETNCKNTSLGISQGKNMNFSLPSETGFQERQVIAFNDQVSKSIEIEYTLLETPSINISNIIFPNQVKYEDNFQIEFTLESKSDPQKTKIKLIHNNFEKELILSNPTQTFQINLKGKDIDKKNEFKILVTYEDKKEKKYTTQETFSIELINLNLFQKIIVFFKNIV